MIEIIGAVCFLGLVILWWRQRRMRKDIGHLMNACDHLISLGRRHNQQLSGMSGYSREELKDAEDAVNQEANSIISRATALSRK